MKLYKLFALVLATLLIAILLGSILNSPSAPIALVDNALADTAPIVERNGGSQPRPNIATNNYLPIIFLNSATAGGAWLLAGNAGTNWTTDFLGTTDNMTLTLRVSNTVAYRIVPAVDPINGFAPIIIGGSEVNSISPAAYGATIAGGGTNGSANVITSTGFYANIAGGFGHTAGGFAATIGGGNFNIVSNYAATVGGGSGNTASGDRTTIGGGRLNTATGNFATISGGSQNTANNLYATVGGGGSNIASGQYATIGGGYQNTTNGDYAFVGGGKLNSASNQYATIGGGTSNIASGDRSTIGGGQNNSTGNQYDTVGGGYKNQASGNRSTIGGGDSNIASGQYATIPGGNANRATMTYTLAAGRRAQANNQGAFVWGDSTDANIYSSGNDQFIVRANGGIAFVTSTVDFTPTIDANVFITTSTGAYLSTAGVWTDVSNKNVKANFVPVNSQDILNRVSSLPIATWNYNADDPSIRHIGPTAQDFYSTFNVGQDDTHLAALDTNGVALAAIQGLAQENQALKAQVDAQGKELKELKERVNDAGTGNPFPISRDALGGAIGALVIVGFVIVGRRRG